MQIKFSTIEPQNQINSNQNFIGTKY